MAGPVTSVLLPTKVLGNDRAWLESMFSLISERREGFDFWVNATADIGGTYAGEGRPFIYSIGPEYWGDFEELSDPISGKFGWGPADQIRLAAMCNRPKDHRILAELALTIARHFGGVIEFGARLSSYTDDLGLLSSPDLLQTAGRGDMMGIPLFSKWLNHDDFRMVK